MNQPKPCLPGCRCTCGDLWENHNPRDLDLWIAESHAPACKNAKPAEPPKPAPEAAKVERQRACRCVAGFEGYCPQHGSSLPFLDPRVRCAPATVKVYPPAGPAPAEKGEVDFEAADFLCTENLTRSDPDYWREEITIARAYFALKAERDALAAEVERLRGENEQLRAESRRAIPAAYRVEARHDR